MELLKCDGGCGRVSPDERGLHIANKWCEVTIKSSACFGKYHVCPACVTGESTNPTFAPLKALTEKLKQVFVR